MSLVAAANSTYALPGADLLGYNLHPDFPQRGITRHAVLALLAWVVKEQAVKEARVDVVVDNVASRRLVESLEGSVREEGEQELVWPESMGGGMKKFWSWRWSST